jgi:hypothetical protein
MPGVPSAGGLLFHVITSLTIPPDYPAPYHQGARLQLRRGEEVCYLVEKGTTLRPRTVPSGYGRGYRNGRTWRASDQAPQERSRDPFF